MKAVAALLLLVVPTPAASHNLPADASLVSHAVVTNASRSTDVVYRLAEVQVDREASSPGPPAITATHGTPWWWKKIGKERDSRYRTGIAALGLLFFLALSGLDTRRGGAWIASAPAAVMLGIASYRTVQSDFVPLGVLVLDGAAVLWIAGGLLLAWRRRSSRTWLVRGALVCVIFSGAAAWINFGAFHGDRVVHYWDMFHYYMGSKYFAENGYDGLYEAALVADGQDLGDGMLENRKIRDLADNRLHSVGKEDVLRYRERCAERFSPERWEAFRRDAREFRTLMGPRWWKDMLMDHGYNGSPVTTAVAAPLTNIGWREPPPLGTFKEKLVRYALIDFALYAASFLTILWAFGLRACALSVLVWGTGFPWGYFWTGGSFARAPWFFFAVAAVCLRKRGAPLLSGFALSWSALLRLFPAALAGGPAARILDRAFRRRGRERPWIEATDRRFLLGGLLGLVVIGGGSLAVNGPASHAEFLSNTLKHAETPLTNHMGLATILSYRPSTVGRATMNDDLADPWEDWKEKRTETQRGRRWLHVTGMAGMLVMLAAASRRLPAWALLSASTILIAGAFELTCYYYSFVVLTAPLAIERARYTAALILLVIAGQVLQFVVGWDDELYIWETIVVLIPLGYILIDLVRNPLPEPGASTSTRTAPDTATSSR